MPANRCEPDVGATGSNRGALVASTTWRLVGVATTLWGGSLLYRGSELWKGVSGFRPERIEEQAIRVLGVRHLVQGVFEAVLPGRFPRALVTIDILHVASMLPLALAPAARRRPVLVSAAVAATSAIALGLLRPAGRFR